MIFRDTVDGQDATVAYLDENFEPVEVAKAKLVKITFDAGDVVFIPIGEVP